MSALTLDRDTVAEYLELYRDVPGLLPVTALLPGTGAGPTVRCKGIGAAQDAIEAFDRDGDRYQGTYLRGTTLREDTPELNAKGNQARGSNIHSDHWIMFSLDIDFNIDGKGDAYPAGPAEAMQLIADSGLPAPSFYVNSGYGCYPKWLLDQPMPHGDDAAELQVDLYRAVGQYFESRGVELDRGIKDASRIWRVPGTINRKRGTEKATSMTWVTR